MSGDMTATDKERVMWERKVAFTGVLPMFEKLQIPWDYHDNRVN